MPFKQLRALCCRLEDPPLLTLVCPACLPAFCQDWCADGSSGGRQSSWVYVDPGHVRHDPSHLVSHRLSLPLPLLAQLLAACLCKQQDSTRGSPAEVTSYSTTLSTGAPVPSPAAPANGMQLAGTWAWQADSRQQEMPGDSAAHDAAAEGGEGMGARQEADEPAQAMAAYKLLLLQLSAVVGQEVDRILQVRLAGRMPRACVS